MVYPPARILGEVQLLNSAIVFLIKHVSQKKKKKVPTKYYYKLKSEKELVGK